MNKPLALLAIALVGATFGCSAEFNATTDPLLTTNSPLSGKAVCWDGVTLPRPALDPIPSATVSTAYDAFALATQAYNEAAPLWQAGYEAALAAQADALNNHPDYIKYKQLYPEYVSALQTVAGTACTTDTECASPSPLFPGVCHLYYQHGQCTVDSSQLPPIPQIPLDYPPPPVPPAQPVFSCTDFTCAANYACELELATGGIACVENRCSTTGGSTGGGSTGGGGRKH